MFFIWKCKYEAHTKKFSASCPELGITQWMCLWTQHSSNKPISDQERQLLGSDDDGNINMCFLSKHQNNWNNSEHFIKAKDRIKINNKEMYEDQWKCMMVE